MGTGTGTLWRGALAAVLSLAAPASASGAVTIGSDLALPASQGATCNPSPCTVANLAVADGGTAVSPITGVVVRWRVRPVGADAEARLNVIRSGGAGTFRSISESQTRSIDADTATTFAFQTRQPIVAGDRVGLTADGFLLATAAMAGAAQSAQWSSPLGATPEAPSTTASGLELLLNADVERDADADGFGDETQDDCPGSLGLRNGCETTPPETTITKAPKRKLKTRKRKRKVKFKFVSSEPGSDFRCAVDDDPPAACDSPFKDKVRRGRHHFEVVAVDRAGNADPSPATAEFKLKRKKRR